MDRKYDVVVIGAGGVGLNIAQLLGGYHLRVHLVESKANPTDVTFHTLGSFAEPRRFGFTREVVAAVQTEVYVHSKHFHIRKRGKGYILKKRQIHQELLERAVEHNVTLSFSTRIREIVFSRGGFVEAVVDDDGVSYHGSVFVDASGSAGVLSRRLGLQDKKLGIATGLEQEVQYYGPKYQTHLFIGKFYQGGYGWIFPLGNKRAILGLGSFHERVRLELKDRLEAMFDMDVLKGLVKKDTHEVRGGTLPITEVKSKFVYKNVLCVGDSVSQVNPLVGEGYRFGLESSLIAAPYIYMALKQNDLSLFRGYEREWRLRFYDQYRMAKRLQVFLGKLSGHDLLIDLVNLFFLTKRDQTFTNFLSGNITRRDICLP